ncbi:MAG TPA: hypothetical protein VHV32_19290 [Candidatus Angelobacter sp.]|jgi:hypothetical protein|nr:hypothetical protein [Candidatus Angelobacter sp.]
MKRSEACSGCKVKPVRGPNQRYCKDCHNEAEKLRQKQIREDAKAFRAAASST